MEIEQQEIAVRYLLDNVFIPQVVIQTQKFLEEYQRQTNYAVAYKLAFGVDIVISKDPIYLDLRQPMENLLKNLLMTFNNQNEKTQTVKIEVS